MLDLTTDSQVNRIVRDDLADVTLADQPAMTVVPVTCSNPCRERYMLNIKTIHVTFGNLTKSLLADLDISPHKSNLHKPQ